MGAVAPLDETRIVVLHGCDGRDHNVFVGGHAVLVAPVADDDGGLCNLGRHEAGLPLAKHEPHVVPAGGGVPPRVAGADVLQRAVHRRVEVGAPRHALVEKEGHVEERRALGVDRAREVIVQQVGVEVGLGRVNAPVVHRVAAAAGVLAPLPPHPRLGGAVDRRRHLVDVDGSAEPTQVRPQRGRQHAQLRSGRPVSELHRVSGEGRSPVLEPRGVRAVYAIPASVALAPAVHARAVARAAVEAIVGADALAAVAKGAVDADTAVRRRLVKARPSAGRL
mmetsp:Transcript_10138/g.32079  ORF Transcript_10138/g.32079 Transcript_10138/m.32079 type:complete len:279 (-) Transcript_10138:138-974(-)